jgi:hypothetical protein
MLSATYYPPPTTVAFPEHKVKVEDMEPILRCGVPEMKIMQERPWKPKVVTLRGGQQMLVRSMREDEYDQLLEAIKPYMFIAKDFYDIVGVRTYGEILAQKLHRIKDAYTLLGIIDGQLAGLANARMFNEKVAYSLHTMSFMRGVDAGPALYYAKAEYAFDYLGADMWEACFESYNGFRVIGVQWAHKSKPYPEFQTELGGARVFYLDRELWEGFIKKKYAHYAGSHEVPQDLVKKSEHFTVGPPIV